MDKREGGGSHNWGTFEDEMKAEEDKNNVSTDAEKTESGDKPEGEKEKDGAPEEPREEEPKTFTLDEWKKQQAKKEEPKFNTRKAGEGSDMDPKWKKGLAYKKERENVHDDEDDEGGDPHTYCLSALGWAGGYQLLENSNPLGQIKNLGIIPDSARIRHPIHGLETLLVIFILIYYPKI